MTIASALEKDPENAISALDPSWGMIMDLRHPGSPLLFQVEEDLGERFNRAANTERAELVENLRAYRQQILQEAPIGIERSALCGTTVNEQGRSQYP